MLEKVKDETLFDDRSEDQKGQGKNLKKIIESEYEKERFVERNQNDKVRQGYKDKNRDYN